MRSVIQWMRFGICAVVMHIMSVVVLFSRIVIPVMVMRMRGIDRSALLAVMTMRSKNVDGCSLPLTRSNQINPIPRHIIVAVSVMPSVVLPP